MFAEPTQGVISLPKCYYTKIYIVSLSCYSSYNPFVNLRHDERNVITRNFIIATSGPSFFKRPRSINKVPSHFLKNIERKFKSSKFLHEEYLGKSSRAEYDSSDLESRERLNQNSSSLLVAIHFSPPGTPVDPSKYLREDQLHIFTCKLLT